MNAAPPPPTESLGGWSQSEGERERVRRRRRQRWWWWRKRTDKEMAHGTSAVFSFPRSLQCLSPPVLSSEAERGGKEGVAAIAKIENAGEREGGQEDEGIGRYTGASGAQTETRTGRQLRALRW